MRLSRGSNYGYLESVVACLKCFTSNRWLFSQTPFHKIVRFFVICDVILLQGILNPLLREVSFAAVAATLAAFLFWNCVLSL